MSSYRLLPRGGTCSFRKIAHGRKWVGRVYQHADGTWLGDINKRTLGKGPTAVAAFEAAVSKHLGFDSVHDLDDHNRQIQAANKVKKARAQYVLSELLRGNYNAFDEMMGFKK